jgi:hypothetical protein
VAGPIHRRNVTATDLLLTRQKPPNTEEQPP